MIEEVKKRYKDLAKLHHPDRGGNTATMQEINNEYAQAIRYAAKGQKMTEEQTESAIYESEEYAQAINKVINLAGTRLEVVGNWLWITGETKQHKDILKTDPAKFTWAKKKDDFSAWFFRTDEWKTRNKQKHTLDQIRAKYGSQTLTPGHYKFIAK
jgi:molecular chaperone DnaK (HSP70)